MLTRTEDIAASVENWLSEFESALANKNGTALKALFHDESYWRDVLAFTWEIKTITGVGAIAAELKSCSIEAQPTGFAIASARTPPRRVSRAGSEAIEAIFQFRTAQGRGSGVLRLMPDAHDRNSVKAWTLLTALDEIKGHEEHIGRARPTGEAYARDFCGPNWLDLRKAAAAYAEHDPVVLVVGGGQAGLCTAARLAQLEIDALIVDRWPRIGDNWRQRYHALTLHNQVHVNHLPYMPFPPGWPTYIPKDKLANWFEAYVEALELNYWIGTELTGGNYDAREKRWTVTLRRPDGTTRQMRPAHIVLATGTSGIPSIPELPGLRDFAGTVLHSTQYRDGEDFAGKRAIVVGTGNSGHDIAQDLTSSGAQVTMLQRAPTLVVNIEPSAQLAYTLYDEGPPLADCDLIAASIPFALVRRSHIALTAKGRELDKPLLDALMAKGFRLDFGEDGSGWQFKYLTRGGGYYFNVGCSDMIADGRIALRQFADVATFTRDGSRMRDGSTLHADLIVLATGYKGQEHLVRKLFGDDVAARVGPIWGFGESEELRNMFVATPQPGLSFISGSLAQCRIYSKYLALRIKAEEIGLV